MNEQDRKRWIIERLKHSLQALALPASEQVSLLPDFVVKTDEFVLDFDHWRMCAVGNYRTDLSEVQQDCLGAVHAHISAPKERAAWDEGALASHPFWQELRRLAKQALDSFGWTVEKPPSHVHEYVRGKRT